MCPYVDSVEGLTPPEVYKGPCLMASTFEAIVDGGVKPTPKEDKANLYGSKEMVLSHDGL